MREIKRCGIGGRNKISKLTREGQADRQTENENERETLSKRDPQQTNKKTKRHQDNRRNESQLISLRIRKRVCSYQPG